jgi:hypothetical protein
MRFIKELRFDISDKEECAKILKSEYEDVVWRLWQEALIVEMKAKPHSSKVIWYVHHRGNAGKTYLADYFNCTDAAFVTDNGKNCDLKYSYSGKRVVIFDFTRSQQDCINYQIIEALKNGCYFSPKYESKKRRYMKPHVVCLSNMMPDKAKLSMDRWGIRDITTVPCEDVKPICHR